MENPGEWVEVSEQEDPASARQHNGHRISSASYGRSWKRGQCCQLSDFVARFSDFSDPFSDFFKKKRLATNLATFRKNLSNFPNVASTVLRARDLELHLSLCLL